MTINVNPSLSFKVSEAFSIGAGLNYQRIDAELTNAVVLGAGVEGRAKLEADDDAWGWNVGVLFQPTASTKIGVSYRSIIDYTLEGTTTVTIPPAQRYRRASGETHADVTLPDSFSISLAQKLSDRWELLARCHLHPLERDQQHQYRQLGQWHFRAISLVLDFDDTWRYSLGANYQLNDGWTAEGRSGIWTRRRSRAQRAARFGCQTTIAPGFPSARRSRCSKIDRLDFGYSHLFVKDAEINFSKRQFVPGTTTINPATVSKVQGRYESSVDLFSVQYTVTF